MGFDEEYQVFLSAHTEARTGERLRRLQEGHGRAEMMFLEKVWWPLFHHFHHLHPEYEVDDFKDGKRYLDYAYIRPAIRICIEIDGYGPHLRNISRWQFADNLVRQNQLVIDGWNVIRFSYDQVKDQPRQCQQMVQQVIGRWLGDELDQTSLSFLEKEILRLAIRKGVPVTPAEIQKYMGHSDKPVKKVLTQLVEKGWLIPASGTSRIRSYRVGDQVKQPI